jgi:hypothetical protein
LLEVEPEEDQEKDLEEVEIHQDITKPRKNVDPHWVKQYHLRGKTLIGTRVINIIIHIKWDKKVRYIHVITDDQQ